MTSHFQSQNGNYVQRAFEDSIKALGDSGVRTLISDLQIYGAYSADSKLISLVGLMDGLRAMLGDEAAEMIMERVMVKMDALHSELPDAERARTVS